MENETSKSFKLFSELQNKSKKDIYYIHNIYHIYIVFTTEGFFEVGIESWSEWDLNPRWLNSVQTL